MTDPIPEDEDPRIPQWDGEYPGQVDTEPQSDGTEMLVPF